MRIQDRVLGEAARGLTTLASHYPAARWILWGSYSEYVQVRPQVPMDTEFDGNWVTAKPHEGAKRFVLPAPRFYKSVGIFNLLEGVKFDPEQTDLGIAWKLGKGAMVGLLDPPDIHALNIRRRFLQLVAGSNLVCSVGIVDPIDKTFSALPVLEPNTQTASRVHMPLALEVKKGLLY